jgi:hypothetical protein
MNAISEPCNAHWKGFLALHATSEPRLTGDTGRAASPVPRRSGRLEVHEGGVTRCQRVLWDPNEIARAQSHRPADKNRRTPVPGPVPALAVRLETGHEHHGYITRAPTDPVDGLQTDTVDRANVDEQDVDRRVRHDVGRVRRVSRRQDCTAVLKMTLKELSSLFVVVNEEDGRSQTHATSMAPPSHITPCPTRLARSTRSACPAEPR